MFSNHDIVVSIYIFFKKDFIFIICLFVSIHSLNVVLFHLLKTHWFFFLTTKINLFNEK